MCNVSNTTKLLFWVAFAIARWWWTIFNQNYRYFLPKRSLHFQKSACLGCKNYYAICRSNFQHRFTFRNEWIGRNGPGRFVSQTQTLGISLRGAANIGHSTKTFSNRYSRKSTRRRRRIWGMTTLICTEPTTLTWVQIWVLLWNWIFFNLVCCCKLENIFICVQLILKRYIFLLKVLRLNIFKLLCTLFKCWFTNWTLDTVLHHENIHLWKSILFPSHCDIEINFSCT